MLGTVRGPEVDGVGGEAPGIEMPRVVGDLLGTAPSFPPPEYLPSQRHQGF